MDERLEKTLVVCEIFKSIQGESTWAGLPCVFIRLTGCNLRCVWCDTEYAFHDGARMRIADILEQVEAFRCDLVEITGGEPLLQKECPTLAACLLERGMTVLCETSGALPIDCLPEPVVTIMDLKSPGSGECDKNDWTNLDRLAPHDEVKFVIADRADFEWCRDVIKTYNLAARCRAVLVSPVFGVLEPQQLTQWVLEDGLPVRVQLQLHKYIWDPSRRGV